MDMCRYYVYIMSIVSLWFHIVLRPQSELTFTNDTDCDTKRLMNYTSDQSE